MQWYKTLVNDWKYSLKFFLLTEIHFFFNGNTSFVERNLGFVNGHNFR